MDRPAALALMSLMSLPCVPRIGFIGAGRLAHCLARRFAQAGFPVVAIASRSRASADALAARIDGCASLDSAQAVVDAVDLVFLAVRDDAIGPVAEALRFAPERASTQALVHCSGASSVDLLQRAHAQGAATGGFHPLYLFGGGDTDLARIDGCSVTIEAHGTLLAVLRTLADALGAHPLSIPPGSRMLYHAAANYAASFALCGLAECIALWRTLGFDEAQALRALLPMLAGTIETAREKGLVDALAGPVSRGDAGIVERQLALLEGLGADHAALYALMTQRAVGLVRQRETPPPPAPAALDAISRSVAARLPAGLAGPLAPTRAPAAPTRDEP